MRVVSLVISGKFEETLPEMTLCTDPTFPWQVEYVTPLTFSSEEGAPLAHVSCQIIPLDFDHMIIGDFLAMETHWRYLDAGEWYLLLRVCL